jgi:pimeloyl-ACP methyl ester carboxylesterase
MDHFFAGPQTLAKVNRRRRINLVITGDGSPSVILAGGHGCTALSWASVQIALGLSARAVSFDQAGMGFSDPGPLPVTGSAVVEDLRAALRSADIAPPYILVGLSLGGLYMRLFAFKYPQEVVGMVMVDSSSEHQHRRFFGENSAQLAALRRGQLRKMTHLVHLARAGALVPGAPEFDASVRAASQPMQLTPAVEAARNSQLASAARWRAMRSEMSVAGMISFEQVDAARRPLGDMPLIVLSAGREVGEALPDETPEQARTRVENWRIMHEEIASLSTRGERRVVDARHQIQIDKPEAVVAAIEEVLAMVRIERSTDRASRAAEDRLARRRVPRIERASEVAVGDVGDAAVDEFAAGAGNDRADILHALLRLVVRGVEVGLEVVLLRGGVGRFVVVRHVQAPMGFSTETLGAAPGTRCAFGHTRSTQTPA